MANGGVVIYFIQWTRSREEEIKKRKRVRELMKGRGEKYDTRKRLGHTLDGGRVS